MRDQSLLNALENIENKISNELDKPSYRNCLLAGLCVKKFTVETAKEIAEKNMLLCTVNDMNLAVCLRNKLKVQKLFQFNDEDNMRYVINCMETEEPLTIINNEVSTFIIESKKLVSEIQEILNEGKTFERNKTILSLFDEDTQKQVNELIKQTFECLKFEFSVVLRFSNKCGKEIIHEVEYAPREFERNRGLSCRPYLPDDAGMFYEFSQEKIHHFITTDVCRDLSVAYIKADGTITEIIERKANDQEVYTNKVPSQYVLEMTKGWFDKNNVQVGDNVKVKTIIAYE